MAKTKISNKGVKLILSLVTLAMALLTVATFFMPTIKYKGENTTKFSAMEVCFVSKDKCVEKVQQATKDLDKEAANHYTQLYMLKSVDDAKTSLNATGWCHFVAMLTSIALVVMLVLSLFGKSFALVSQILAIVTVLLMIGTIASLGALMNVTVNTIPLKDAFSAHAGAILGLITSVIVSVMAFIKVKGQRAV